MAFYTSTPEVPATNIHTKFQRTNQVKNACAELGEPTFFGPLTVIFSKTCCCCAPIRLFPAIISTLISRPKITALKCWT
jgi:hypothetical protein